MDNIEMKDFISKSSRLESILNKYKLTKREIEITLFWIADYDYKEISTSFSISNSTVRKHIQNINSKINVHSKSALILTILLELMNINI